MAFAAPASRGSTPNALCSGADSSANSGGVLPQAGNRFSDLSFLSTMTTPPASPPPAFRGPRSQDVESKYPRTVIGAKSQASVPAITRTTDQGATGRVSDPAAIVIPTPPLLPSGPIIPISTPLTQYPKLQNWITESERVFKEEIPQLTRQVLEERERCERERVEKERLALELKNEKERLGLEVKREKERQDLGLVKEKERLAALGLELQAAKGRLEEELKAREILELELVEVKRTLAADGQKSEPMELKAFQDKLESETKAKERLEMDLQAAAEALGIERAEKENLASVGVQLKNTVEKLISLNLELNMANQNLEREIKAREKLRRELQGTLETLSSEKKAKEGWELQFKGAMDMLVTERKERERLQSLLDAELRTAKEKSTLEVKAKENMQMVLDLMAQTFGKEKKGTEGNKRSELETSLLAGEKEALEHEPTDSTLHSQTHQQPSGLPGNVQHTMDVVTSDDEQAEDRGRQPSTPATTPETNDVEPNDTWKAMLRAQIKENVLAMVDEANSTLEKQLRQMPPEHEVRLRMEHRRTLTSFAASAEAQFRHELNNECQRRWKAGYRQEIRRTNPLSEQQPQDTGYRQLRQEIKGGVANRQAEYHSPTQYWAPTAYAPRQSPSPPPERTTTPAPPSSLPYNHYRRASASQSASANQRPPIRQGKPTLTPEEDAKTKNLLVWKGSSSLIMDSIESWIVKEDGT
ncbi:hypothetical protein FA15DRAFT_673405 [Coprinopsis marcescibilis]|uniref:Uncharacterized protein n=1 Tax=Coprinopsis marcescibilis TaxID=230819 RepID=A0A5C3KJW7_COPMA|nr:hypothetical protein FA15DRAFT_673405 [Coprinopsis marcescibilis]